MLLIDWEKLPEHMQNDDVRIYYDILKKKSFSLIVKRIFDIILSLFLLILLFPIMFVIAIMIKCDSPGKVFFRQTRITQFGKEFKIFKFRTMVSNAQSLGPQVTAGEDIRITKVGKLLRGLRIDEFPQLINVLLGQMTFVGTRPEAPIYVEKYSQKMMATLLLPAGVTSLASIKFKDEADLLGQYDSPDEAYVEVILPQKMKFNLEYIENFNFIYDLKVIIMTVIAVIKR